MTRKATIVSIAVLCFCLWFRAAHADIYQYTDKNGVVHFTNVNGGKKYKRVKREKRRIRATKENDQQGSSMRSFTPSDSSSEQMPTKYSGIIDAACRRYGIDPSLVQAIVKVESDFNPYALSRAGAMGLMQLMPKTAKKLNVKNSFNPWENIHGGVKYLRHLMDRYEGNLLLALAAYNAGETAVRDWGTVPPYRETQRYVRKVMRIYNGEDTIPVRRYTIYMGYNSDGSLLITDNPSSHQNKRLRRKAAQSM